MYPWFSGRNPLGGAGLDNGGAGLDDRGAGAHLHAAIGDL